MMKYEDLLKTFEEYKEEGRREKTLVPCVFAATLKGDMTLLDGAFLDCSKEFSDDFINEVYNADVKSEDFEQYYNDFNAREREKFLKKYLELLEKNGYEIVEIDSINSNNTVFFIVRNKIVYTEKQWMKDRTFKAEVGQEIEEDIYFEMLDCVPPLSLSPAQKAMISERFNIKVKSGFLVGEAYDHIDGRAIYSAFVKDDNRYYFVGYLNYER